MRGDFRVGNWLVQPQLNSISDPGKTVKVEPRAMEVLVYLAGRTDEVLSKDRIIQAVWSDTYVTDNALTHAISELRKAFDDDAQNPKVIETIPGRGYRLLAKPQPVGNGERPGWYKTALITTALALLGVLVVLLVWQTWSPASIEEPIDSVASTGRAPISYERRPLTTWPGEEQNPVFSPDGEWVAFERVREGEEQSDIWIIPTTGEGKRNLTDTPEWSEYSPAWSPDGKQIAFVRVERESEEFNKIVTIPALGGSPVERFSGFEWTWFFLSWSPDGEHLVFSGSLSGEPPVAIYQLSLQTHQVQQLTSPPEGIEGDVYPEISPDGRHLLFVRTRDWLAMDLFVGPVEEGVPQQLTHDELVYSPTWTADGKEIVYADLEDRRWTLKRISAEDGQPQLLGIDEAMDLDVAAVGGRLVYGRFMVHHEIRRSSLVPSPTGQCSPSVEVVPSTWKNDSPRISPDGQWLVFNSNRRGRNQLFVTKIDGSDPYPVHDGGWASAWSPDSRKIAFYWNREGSRDVYVVDRSGGEPQRITTWESVETATGWSKDGRWIYFSSNRTGDLQIWRIPVAGGEAKQITRDGGLGAIEGPGGWIYYRPTRGRERGLRRVRADGTGDEALLQDEDLWNGWAVMEEGIYWLARKRPPSEAGPYAVKFFDFASQQVTTVCSLEQDPIRREMNHFHGTFVMAPDRSYFLWVGGQTSRDIMLVENFR